MERIDAPGLVAIDDSAATLSVVAALARANGYDDVETFQSVAAALASLKRRGTRKTVLVCDLNMPGADGVELFKSLSHTAFEGPIVILSGADDRVLKTAANLAQAYGLDLRARLSKPVQPDAFGRLLAALHGA